MIVLTAAAVLIALYAGASLYVRRAARYLQLSEAPWQRMYEAARKVINDEAMPNAMAGFAAAAVLCAGCGCLTRRILLDMVSGKHRKAMAGPPTRVELAMTSDQKKLYNRLVVNAIYYDALRAPISGFILRRIAMPWIRAASEDQQPSPKVKVARMAASSREAIASREEGRKVLALA